MPSASNAVGRLWVLTLCVWGVCGLGCERHSENAAAPGTRAPPSSATGPKAARASGEDRAAQRETEGPLVAFLGDSISAGLHLPADAAYPAVLARRLSEQGKAFRLLNAGVSGDTTAGGLRRVDWLLKQRPTIVVIELGGNDGLRGVPLDVIEQNLEATIAKIRAAGATPLLLGMRLPPSYGAPYAEGFDGLYPRLAERLGIAFVPFFMKGVAGVPELLLEDGLHPTAAGHGRLAENVEEALAKLVAEAGQLRASESR